MRYFSREFQVWFVITRPVLHTFRRYRQRKADHPEVGGQLFGTFHDNEVWVEAATVTPSRGGRMRYFFHPDRDHEQRDIDVQFVEGRHYLGDWHTHPESSPTPSSQDLSTMLDCFAKSRHELKAFLQVIVGFNTGRDGLWVGIHSDRDCLRLEVVDSRATNRHASRDPKLSNGRKQSS
jgi:integrative and conjugative element protein (TIGR02256 family)